MKMQPTKILVYIHVYIHVYVFFLPSWRGETKTIVNAFSLPPPVHWKASPYHNRHYHLTTTISSSSLSFSSSMSSSSSSSISSNSNSNSNSQNILEFITICGKLKTTLRAGWIERHVDKYPYYCRVESVADHTWRVSVLCLLLFHIKDNHHVNHHDNHNNDDDDVNDDDVNDDVNDNDGVKINVAKCMQMAILHDLAECQVGDITPNDNVSSHTKYQLEHASIQYLSNLLSSNDDDNDDDNEKDDDNDTTASSYLLNLWKEYEARESMEAKAVKDLDLLDMIVQANEYELQMCACTNTNANTTYQNNDDNDDNDKDDCCKDCQGCDALQDFFDSTPPQRFQIPYLQSLAHEIHQQRDIRLESSSCSCSCSCRVREHTKHKNSNVNVIPKETRKQEDGTEQIQIQPQIQEEEQQQQRLSEKDVEFAINYAKSSNLTVEEVTQLLQAYHGV